MATTVSLKPNAVEISGSTSGTTTLQATAVAGTTTLTLPAATDTLVGRTTTDTLTNKTLTGAAMNGTLGATTPSTGAFTTLSATGNVTLGDASTDTLNVGNGDLIKDASGNLLVGTTGTVTGARLSSVAASGSQAAAFKSDASTAVTILNLWGNETSGNQIFVRFATDSNAERGSITYNRGAGVIAYNVTSDYRAKDINGPVVDSGALIDSTPVYMGKMKGATQERPMFIAHETPAYAHTGEKDAIDKDGNPVYQQMDTSALVPVMWAEIQSLRKRLSALESA